MIRPNPVRCVDTIEKASVISRSCAVAYYRHDKKKAVFVAPVAVDLQRELTFPITARHRV